MSIKTHGEKPSFLNTVGAVISVINRGTGLLFWSVSCLGILFLPETLILIIRAFLALDGHETYRQSKAIGSFDTRSKPDA